MSSSHATDNPQSPLSYTSFLWVAWTFTTTAFILTIGRYIVRKCTLKKLLLDDYIHGFATVVLIIYISVYTALYPLSNAVELWGLKQGPEPSKASLTRFLHLELTGEFLFWVVLYSVKFTFLAFYRHLFGVSHIFRRCWWGVFTFTSLAFCSCFLTPFWTCGTPSKFLVLKSCLSASAQAVTDNYAETCVALNIASDLAIMALPLWMLKNMQLPTSKKLGLASIFFLAFAIVVLDILRIALGDGGGIVSLASLWDVLEPSVAVIVSTLPTYRALLPSPEKSSKKKVSAYEYGSNGTSESKQSWKSRIKARQLNEGYELSEDFEILRPATLSGESPSTYPDTASRAASRY